MPSRQPRQIPEFAQRIRHIRQQLNLTPEQAADRAGMSWIYWRQIEAGIRTNPSLDTLQKMAMALGCQVADFFAEQNHAA